MRRSFVPFLILAAFSLPAFAVDYQEEIRPILNDKCFKCHSGPRAKGKLRMDQESYFSKRIGGDDPVIVPGNPGNSLLAVKAGLPRSDGDAMPPPPARERGAEPLTDVELNLVKQWIAEGASFEAGAAPVPTSAEEPGSMEPQLLDWTNTAGNSLKAYFVAFNGTDVKLRKEDGSEFVYPAAQLSAESQEQAKKLAVE